MAAAAGEPAEEKATDREPAKADAQEPGTIDVSAAALASFRSAFSEVQDLSANEEGEGNEEALQAAKARLAFAMKAAMLAGVSEADLLAASAPPPEEEEDEAPEEPDDGVALRPGVRVEIFGLESEGGKALNGQVGTISEYVAEKERFQVHLGAGKFVSVRPANLKRSTLAEQSAPPAAAPKDPTQEDPIKSGDRVEVFGLESESGMKLNGRVGIAGEFVADKGRFKIELGSEEAVAVKPVNLKRRSPAPKKRSRSRSSSSSASSARAQRSKGKKGLTPEEVLEKLLKGEAKDADKARKSARSAGAEAAAAAAAAVMRDLLAEQAATAAAAASAPLKLGDRVEVYGLLSDTGCKLNGKTGLLTKWDPEKGRFQVELGMANVQSFRPENVRRAAKPNTPTEQPEYSAGAPTNYSGSTAGYTLL